MDWFLYDKDLGHERVNSKGKSDPNPEVLSRDLFLRKGIYSLSLPHDENLACFTYISHRDNEICPKY